MDRGGNSCRMLGDFKAGHRFHGFHRNKSVESVKSVASFCFAPYLIEKGSEHTQDYGLSAETTAVNGTVLMRAHPGDSPVSESGTGDCGVVPG